MGKIKSAWICMCCKTLTFSEHDTANMNGNPNSIYANQCKQCFTYVIQLTPELYHANFITKTGKMIPMAKKYFISTGMKID